MTTGIYILYWNNNGYFYFGQSKNIELRAKAHTGSMRSGTHRNKRIQNVFNKYGNPVIELWIQCDTDSLNDAEQYLISFSLVSKKCLNIRPNVQSLLGYRHTDETKLKLSMAGKKNLSKRSSESLREMRKGLMAYNDLRSKGIIVQGCSDITKSKMSDKRKLGNHPRAKKVIDKSTGKIYDCARSASNDSGINYSTLRDWLNNRKPNKSTFHFLN